MRRVLGGAVVLCALAVAVVWPRSTEVVRQEERALTAPRVSATAPAVTAPLPASLAGTEIDGHAAVTGGDLVVDRELRRLFDYHLSAHGEEALEVTRARIHAVLDERLPPRAAAQAKEILARYLAYREAAKTLSGGGELADRLAELSALRRRVLGDDVAAAFFGEEEAEVRLALERQKALENPTLSDEERARALAAAEAQAPPSVREAQAESTAAIAGMEAEQALRERGATDEEIHAERVRRFGPEAAARLGELDARRAAWRERVERYRTEKARDPQAAAAMAARDFTAEERLRLEALERIATEDPRPVQ